jgi:hypothetical protein
MVRIAPKSKAVWGAVVALAVLALTASAALAAAPAPPAGSAVTKSRGIGTAVAPSVAPLAGPQAELVNKQAPLVGLAQSVAASALAAGSDVAGVSIDPDTKTLHIYRTNLAKGTGLGLVPAGVSVDVQQAKFSRQQMLATAQQMTWDAQALGNQRVAVEAVGPTLDGSGVNVTVFGAAADVSRATRVLHSRYGAIVNTVRGADTKPSASQLFFAGFRFNDYAPWYGGDRISSTSVGCSTGFAATYNGAPAMLTASHCGGVGTTFWNGPTSAGGWNVMGNVNYSNTNTDVASIGVTSTTNYINVGSDPQSPTQLYVGSWASPIVGEYLCQSGSYTGERCGLRVVDTGQYVCLSTVLWICTSWQGPLADAVSIYGPASPAAGHGDSGGPVYLRSGTTGIAKGLVHGQLTPNAKSVYPAYFPDNLGCPSPEGWSNRCAAGFSFAHMPGY